MKTIIFITIFSVLTSVAGFAQDNFRSEPQTLFSSGTQVTGWFIDFGNSHSNINGKYTCMPGFAGGVVMNNNFRIGLAAKSLSYSETYLKSDNVLGEPAYLVGGYAGLFLESSPFDWKVFHVTFPVIIGGGGAAYLSKDKYINPENYSEWDYSRRELDSSPFFVIEPGVNLELNVTSFMKLYSGLSYRWANGLQLQNTSRNAFNHSNFNVGLKFGKF